MKPTPTLLLAAFFLFTFSGKPKKADDLFNGKNLDGWTTFVSKPHKSVDVPGLAKDASGQYTEPLGLNNDPLKIFSVVQEDGKPAIKATGQVFSEIGTVKEYGNYHLTLQFKWGEQKYEPRLQAKRDAGLLYHGNGTARQGGVWSEAQEMQIQEGDCGDFHPIVTSMIDIRAKRDTALRNYVYDPSAGYVTFSLASRNSRCIKGADNEKPHGQWNTVEIYTLGDKSLHIMNGKVVMALANSRHVVNGKEEPLTKGKILLQAEGAVVFYREIRIEPVNELPAAYRALF